MKIRFGRESEDEPTIVGEKKLCNVVSIICSCVDSDAYKRLKRIQTAWEAYIPVEDHSMAVEMASQVSGNMDEPSALRQVYANLTQALKFSDTRFEDIETVLGYHFAMRLYNRGLRLILRKICQTPLYSLALLS